MSDNRIILRLNERIEFEREFGARYRAVPRARRQEWVRNILRMGLAGLEGGAELVVAPVLAAPAPVAAAPVAAAPVAAAPTPTKVVAAPAPAPAAEKTVKTAKSADALVGFFGNT